MKILSLELFGYRRMRLINVERFKITLNEVIQLILGTNGSGKSSLMEEMTPLPAIPANYTKSGYKIIEISHRGQHYQLKSEFSPSARHTFIKGTENLNPGGTITVQKELVRQEFGITPEIHELLIGAERFTQMSPARRREWFVELGEANYDYALSVFARLKERHRDIAGALKLAKKRLVHETSKLITEEEQAKLRQEVLGIHSELTLLLENRQPLNRTLHDNEADTQRLSDEIERVSHYVLQSKITSPDGEYYDSIEAIEQALLKLRGESVAKETLIREAVAQHSKTEQAYNLLLKTGSEGVASLEARIAPIQAEIDRCSQSKKLLLTFDQPDVALHLLETLEPQLLDIFSELPENTNKEFSQGMLDQYRAEQLELKTQKHQREDQLARLNAQKQHLEHHKKEGGLSCPKCQHQWIPGYDPQTETQLLQAINRLDEETETLHKQILKLDERIEAILQYGRLYKEYVRCTNNSPLLRPFWNYLQDEGWIITNPRRVLTALNQLRQDLGFEQKIVHAKRQLLELDELAQQLAQVEIKNLKEVKHQLDQHTETIGVLTREVVHLKQHEKALTNYLERCQEAFTLRADIERLLQQFDVAFAERILILRMNAINFCIRELQTSLAIKEKQLSELDLQRGIIADLSDQIQKLTLEEEAAKHLVNELSPTDGLIAEGLFGFIRTYVNQMNKLIRKTWSYALDVIPCGVSDGAAVELDYKFPMAIQGDLETPVPDVSKGSKGQREIVDVSFKIVAMKHLGLSHAPLILDEFGEGFDHQHKTTSVQLIKSLMEQQSFSQLLMVSHDFVQYAAFPRLDICVLCGDNIVVPEQYNHHVIME